jgi:TfoX/Sxy family transcriptional regulator of competence genes
MPYNKEIENRMNPIIAKWGMTDQKKMFGGVCYLMNGNMIGGIYKDYMILRLGEEAAAEALKQSHVRVFDITGRPMKGWVMVDQDGFRDEAELEAWLIQARDFVATLPPK